MGLGWRVVAPGSGTAGRRRGTLPGGEGSHTPRTLSCTCTGTWRRSRRCWLAKEERGEQGKELRSAGGWKVAWTELFPIA